MLILTSADRLKQYNNYEIIAQNLKTYDIIIESKKNYDKEIHEIPVDFVQTCLPATYGKYLKWSEIQIIRENIRNKEKLEKQEQENAVLMDTILQLTMQIGLLTPQIDNKEV